MSFGGRGLRQVHRRGPVRQPSSSPSCSLLPDLKLILERPSFHPRGNSTAVWSCRGRIVFKKIEAARIVEIESAAGRPIHLGGYPDWGTGEARFGIPGTACCCAFRRGTGPGVGDEIEAKSSIRFSTKPGAVVSAWRWRRAWSAHLDGVMKV